MPKAEARPEREHTVRVNGRTRGVQNATPPSERVGQEALLAHVAHEIRTPLAALLMWVRLLRSGEAHDLPTALRAIEESACELSLVIDGLRAAAAKVRASEAASPRGAGRARKKTSNESSGRPAAARKKTATKR
jgi:signal transduction histidine kinase